MTDTETEVAETEFFTDSTQPRAYTGDMVAAIANTVDNQANIIEYALYSDETTWNAWAAWAVENAYDGTNWTRFSGRALMISGKWDTIGEGEKSTMCMADASTSSPKGAICMEADITVVNAENVFTTHTYIVQATSVDTLLVDNDTVDRAATSIDFAGDSGAAEVVAGRNSDNTDLNGMWESFDVMKCELSTNRMTCYQWVVAEEEAALETVYGYRRWANETPVKFTWFDGRDLSVTYASDDELVIGGVATEGDLIYPADQAKVMQASVNLVLQPDLAGAFSLTGAVSMAFLTTAGLLSL